MAKSNKFKSGDYVSCTKPNGKKFVGIYSYEYDSGDHCVSDGKKLFCIAKKDCKEADEYEKEQLTKELKEAKKMELLEEEMEETSEV